MWVENYLLIASIFSVKSEAKSYTENRGKKESESRTVYGMAAEYLTGHTSKYVVMSLKWDQAV